MVDSQEADSTNPQAIRMYTTKTLAEQREVSIQIAAALTPAENRTTVILNGDRLYSAGVRAVYLALCQIELTGRSGQIDAREVSALRQGMEDYLVPRKG